MGIIDLQPALDTFLLVSQQLQEINLQHHRLPCCFWLHAAEVAHCKQGDM